MTELEVALLVRRARVVAAGRCGVPVEAADAMVAYQERNGRRVGVTVHKARGGRSCPGC